MLMSIKLIPREVPERWEECPQATGTLLEQSVIEISGILAFMTGDKGNNSNIGKSRKQYASTQNNGTIASNMRSSITVALPFQRAVYGLYTIQQLLYVKKSESLSVVEQASIGS